MGVPQIIHLNRIMAQIFQFPNLVGLPNQIWPILRVHWLLPCLGCPVSSSKPKKTTFKTTTTNSHRSPNLQNWSNSKILEITYMPICINQGSSRLSCGKPNVVPKGAWHPAPRPRGQRGHRLWARRRQCRQVPRLQLWSYGCWGLPRDVRFC